MNNQTRLLDLAHAAAANAHAPYSGFCVGAAILSASGNFYSGCNIENVSYPLGTCAEEAAIAAMVTAGDSKITAILIYAAGKSLITPCGACRQRIAEFSDDKTLIYLADQQGIQKTFTVAELLPFHFMEF